MGFFGHYNEPNLEVNVPRSAFVNGKCMMNMVYDTFKMRWEKAIIGETELKMAQEVPETKKAAAAK